MSAWGMLDLLGLSPQSDKNSIPKLTSFESVAYSDVTKLTQKVTKIDFGAYQTFFCKGFSMVLL